MCFVFELVCVSKFVVFVLLFIELYKYCLVVDFIDKIMKVEFIVVMNISVKKCEL